MLPFAALLSRLELFHAARDTRPHGDRPGRHVQYGKTWSRSTSCCAGARLFTDDVIAVETTAAGNVMCAPGPAAANLRDGRLRALAVAGERPFRRVVGASPASLRTLVEREPRPLPLGALYFLDHGNATVAIGPTRSSS